MTTTPAPDGELDEATKAAIRADVAQLFRDHDMPRPLDVRAGDEAERNAMAADLERIMDANGLEGTVHVLTDEELANYRPGHS